VVGLLSYSRRDAAALPLSEATVETVIARTRTAVLAQLLVAIGIVAGLLLAGRAASGTLAMLFYGLAALAMWGLLGAALSTWDHFRTAAPLRAHLGLDLARESDPAKFWRAHRGLFPYFSLPPSQR